MSGRVVSAGSHAGIAHAQVVAARVGGQTGDYRTAVADGKGRFSFPAIPPGTYRVYATREGFLRGEFGRRGVGASGVPVVLGDGQSIADLEVTLTPTGAIAGRVLDRGRPVRNAWVRALKARYVNGERTLSVAEWTQTDDRGEYRLFDLAPGLYYVAAVPPDRPRIDGSEVVTRVTATNANGNRTTDRSALSLQTVQAAAFDQAVYPPVYHPGTTDAAAALPIDVRGGETATGIELPLTTSRVFHVRGRVTATGAGDSPNLLVSLAPLDGSWFLRIPNPPLQAGSFDFPQVPPGRYVLSAQTRVPPEPVLRDAVEVDVVDRDIEIAALSLRPGVNVRGRLTIEGQPPAATRTIASVQLRSRIGFFNYTAVQFEPDGTFTIENVVPRDYRFQVLGARNNWVRSARYGEDDALNGPVRIAADQQGRLLEVDLGDRPPILDAVVLDAERRPVSGVLVVAVPDAARREQSTAYRSATTGSDGRARLEGLEPGEYTLFASESVEAADWQDPAIVQRHEGRGTTVRIAQGETASVTLRIR